MDWPWTLSVHRLVSSPEQEAAGYPRALLLSVYKSTVNTYTVNRKEVRCAVLIGDRLRRGRIASGLSLRDLAGRVGVSATAISKYERGLDVPRPAILMRLAKALDVQTEFFFREVKADLYCPAFRCRSLSRRREAAIASVIAETVERYLALEELFLHKDEGRRLPNLRSVKTLHDAELAAEELRNKWELGQDPVDNLTRRLEDRGVQVLTIEGIEGLDGYSCIANGVVPVIASCTGLPGDRQRFTLAHELAHLVLEICASVDEEKAAHRFAAAFLAPKRVMFSRLGSSRSSLTLYELGILKRELGMSMQAIVKRAFDLGIIQERTYHEIFGRFSSFGWRKEEPGPQLPVEKPERFGLLINQALAEGILTPSTARKLAGEPAREKPATGLSSVSEAVIDEYLKNEELIALAKATTGDMYDYEKSWDPSR